MNIAGHIEALRADLIATAGIGDESTLRVAEQLSRALDPAMRLRLLDILSEAALEVNGQLTSGQIEVRLAGGDVGFTYSESSHEAEPAVRRRPGRPHHAAHSRAAEDTRRGRRGGGGRLAEHLAGARDRRAPSTAAGSSGGPGGRRITGYATS